MFPEKQTTTHKIYIYIYMCERARASDREIRTERERGRVYACTGKKDRASTYKTHTFYRSIT